MKQDVSRFTTRGHRARSIWMAAALLGAGCSVAPAQPAQGVSGNESGLAAPDAGHTAGLAASRPTTEGRVQIRTIRPAASQPLTAGERVQVTVEVAYALPRPQGRLALALQEPPPTRRPLAATVAELTSAEGVVTLSAEVLVPASATLEVYVPLYARDGQATAVVDARSYRIVPPR
jgi:hypothetical protein